MMFMFLRSLIKTSSTYSEQRNTPKKLLFKSFHSGNIFHYLPSKSKCKVKQRLTKNKLREEYLEPSQTSTMELFAKIVNG